MKVAGQAVLRAPAEQVWAALHNPALLARAFPGCERLAVSGSGSGQFTVRSALPAVAGIYSGQLSLADQRPGFLAVKAESSGDQGTICADITLRLTPADRGATLISYEVNGVVGGAVAGVGSRLVASAASRLATEFFSSVDELLSAQIAADPVLPADSAEPAPMTGASLAGVGATKHTGIALVAGAVAGVIIGMLLGRRTRPAALRRGAA
jgi:carbon monoxide dehydrogenase subunit G